LVEPVGYLPVGNLSKTSALLIGRDKDSEWGKRGLRWRKREAGHGKDSELKSTDQWETKLGGLGRSNLGKRKDYKLKRARPGGFPGAVTRRLKTVEVSAYQES